MWVKVDDGLPDHEKVFHAASFLPKPRFAGGRVIAVWLEAICLVNRKHWNGFISTAAVAALRHDPKPLEVAVAMTQELPPAHGSTEPRRGLLVAVEGGFQFHHYHDQNFTPEEIEARRQKKVAAGKKGGEASGKARAAKQTGSKTEARCFDFTKQTGSTVLSNSEAQGQAETKPDPDPLPQRADQEQRAARAELALVRREPPNVRALTALAHDVIQNHVAGGDVGDLIHALKGRAAQLRMAYDGQSTRQAVESALFQRARRKA